MKNARPQKTGTSANDKRDFTPGSLPIRRDSVIAATLASMLEGKALTGLDAVNAQNTTRLSAVIFELAHTYGWPICRQDIAAGTSDGRISWVTLYWLHNRTREAALKAGGGVWVDGVVQARTLLRRGAAKCKRKAARMNLAKGINTAQMNLWESK